MIDQIKAFIHAVPTVDKVLTPIGVTSSVVVSSLDSYLGIAVAGVTLMVLIPRAFIGWLDLRERLRLKVRVEVEDRPEE